MSFHNKSAWACFVSTLAIWGTYFAVIWALPEEQSGIAIPAAIAAIVVQTAVMIASHMAFAVFGLVTSDSQIRAGGQFDERDRSIALRSSSWAGWVLSFGVFFGIVFFPMRELAMQMDPIGELATGVLASPFTTGNILLLWFVVSELVHYGAAVVLYRRG